MESKKTIVLFDVDGTLTKPRNKIQQDMIDTLNELKKKVFVGFVGGSDYSKVHEQLGEIFFQVDWTFTENGLYALKNGVFLEKTSLKDKLGEENIKCFVNFCLKYLSEIEIPVKRGTFIEYRNGMINVSPIGRNCSQEERDAFEIYDKEHKIREKFINALKENFPDLPVHYSIGGQISFDVMPHGWDKSYCLKFLGEYEEIHFFGDKTFKGGNDYEIFTHPKVIGHNVSGPEDTIRQLNDLFFLKK